MTEHYQQDENQQPYFYDLWQVHQGRGVLAQNQQQYEDAVVQYSIAAFVLLPEGQPMAKLCRAHSLVALANVYILMERFDRAALLLQDVIALRQDLLPKCHPLTAETNHLLANALRGLKLYKDADGYYRQACDCLFQLLPPEDPYLKRVIGNWLVSDGAWNATNDLANLNDAGQSG